MSITHNKKRISLLNLVIYSMSARSASPILSIKRECAFPFMNFLIIALCNSLDKYLLDTFSFLIPLLFIEEFINH